MGLATITGGGTDGLYTAKIEYDTTGAATSIAAIDAEIEQIDEEIVLVEEEMVKVQVKADEKEAEHAALYLNFNLVTTEALETNAEAVTHPEANSDGGTGITTLPGYTGKFELDLDSLSIELPDLLRSAIGSINLDVTEAGKTEVTTAAGSVIAPDNENLRDSFTALITATAELHALQNILVSMQKLIDLREFRREQLEKRKAELQAATAEGVEQDMWCADYTLTLSGDADTLEVMGAPSTVIIGPGGASTLTPGATSRLARIMATSPAQTGLAWALLPGWQKWRPTYRVGVIGNIDTGADTADVTLDAALSAVQSLDVNQAPALTGIPVEYMECNAEAFEAGDRVVVEFPGQLWDTEPKVIGFETHPKPCTGPGFPAWHTFDADGNFIGLTVCLSGKWAPPYEFIPCTLAEVHDFDDGLWNTYNGATPPVGYTMREVDDTWSEVPAAHEYTAKLSESISRVTEDFYSDYVTDAYIDTVACEDEDAIGQYMRLAHWREHLRTQYRLLIITDWSGPTGPLVYQYNEYSQAEGPFWIRQEGPYYWIRDGVYGSIGGEPWSSGTACEQLYLHMSAVLEGGSLDWYDEYYLQQFFDPRVSEIPKRDWRGGPHWSWNVDRIQFGVIPDWQLIWGSYADAAGNGVAVVGQTVKITETNFRRDGETSVTDYPNNTSDPVNTQTDNSFSRDQVLNFGTTYTLNTGGPYISACNPRIYAVDGEYTTLISIRRSGGGWEYLAFKGSVEQYNDPAVTFTERDHPLPLQVEGQTVYGNGEFSLLIPTPEAEE